MRKIYLQHIPKTAGTSLNIAIKIQYPNSQLFPWDNTRINESIERFKTTKHEDQQRIRLIKGHYVFGLHEHWPCSFNYVTFIRSPHNRAISHLHQWIRMDNSSVKNQFNRGVKVRDILRKNPELGFENLQTSWISGIYPIKNYPGEELLSLAKENIEKHYSVVGLVEKFNESLLLLSQSLKWKFPPVYSVLNRTTPKEKSDIDLDQNDLDCISEMNQVDVELYDYCLKRLKDQVLINKINLHWYELQLKAFQKAHWLYSKMRK